MGISDACAEKEIECNSIESQEQTNEKSCTEN